MCGIAGSINRERERPVEEGLLRRMCDAIEHRGPDDEGYYRDGPVDHLRRALEISDRRRQH